MRLLILCAFLVLSCTTKIQTPNDIILGSWLYDKVGSLGDYSQNDKESKDEFDKSMTGKSLTFYKDHTYKATVKKDGVESVLQSGKYEIKADGKTMTMGNEKELKVFISDSAFKTYSPNNACLVWRKIKD
ncbi:MAG: hypothetical protein H0X70_05015 [Segetibacter sp.]|nr:hypothetical protein [Segetibacter sp.]